MSHLIFLGCGGSQNNFASKADCETKCRFHLKSRKLEVTIEEETDPICSLPIKQGIVTRLIHQYAYSWRIQYMA